MCIRTPFPLPWRGRHASEFSVLQCVAVCCSVLQYVAVCCGVLQCGCSVLQCVAVCRSVLQCVVVCCSVLQCVAICYIVLQCVAVCCSMLQCVAVCCSVLQCAASTLRYIRHRAVQHTRLSDILSSSPVHTQAQHFFACVRVCKCACMYVWGRQLRRHLRSCPH